MFAATCQDMREVCYKVVFGDAEAKKAAPETIPKGLEKFLRVLEGLIAKPGFVQGLGFPTVADMVLLNFAEANGPFQDAVELAGFSWQDKYPKIKATVELVKEVPSVRSYLDNSSTIKVQLGPAFIAGLVGKSVGHFLSFGLFRGVSFDRGTEPPPAGPLRPQSPVLPEQPELIYFSIAGRGELARLICAAGGVDLKMTDAPSDYAATVGMFGSLPVLKHGTMTIAQSGAIESYLASLAPKFWDLTPQQHAYNDFFAATKEDILAGCAAVVFGDDEAKGKAPEKVPELLDKYLTVLEGLVPDSGFIQGLEIPTTADLVLLNVTEAVMPFKAAIDLAGGYDWQTKFPKINANVIRTKEAPGVKEYLLTSTSMSAKPS